MNVDELSNLSVLVDFLSSNTKSEFIDTRQSIYTDRSYSIAFIESLFVTAVLTISEAHPESHFTE